MAHIGWRFPPLLGGPSQGHADSGIESFKGSKLIEHLAREICQNSLDARDDSLSGPVKVVFQLKNVEVQAFDAFTQYRNCLQGCRKYWGTEIDENLDSFLAEAEYILNQQQIPIFIASDYNTKGLTGAKSNQKRTPWEALTSSDGTSVKDRRDSGGSFGIGKNAPFACSSLRVVFYNTLDKDGNSAFIGVSRLGTILDEKQRDTQRTGKYQLIDDENQKWSPIFREDKCPFRDSFSREKIGTDVIIAGFNLGSDWYKKFPKVVLKNFFVAIIENRLVVELRDGNNHELLNSDTIKRMLSEQPVNKDFIQVKPFYEAFTEPDFKIPLSILDQDDVEVYMKAGKDYKRDVAFFRSTGMLINYKKYDIFQQFAAVVIVRGSKLGELLKKTETPQHNKWDYGRLPESKREQAKTTIEKLYNEVLRQLQEKFETTSQDEIDPLGIAEFLPDSDDDVPGTSANPDPLNVDVQIASVLSSRKRTPHTAVKARKTTGETKSNSSSSSKNGQGLPQGMQLSLPVIPDKGTEQNSGATPNIGKLTTISPSIIPRRAFPVNVSQGVYKIIILPTKTLGKLFVSFSAVGEDGNRDLLEMDKLEFNGSQITIKDDIAGPITIQCIAPAVFYATFRNKEKMQIEVQLMENI